MSSLIDKLAKFESRLQGLIEHGTTRIVPERVRQNQLSSSLVSAMQNSVKIDEEGRPFAADTYILVVDQNTNLLLTEDTTLNEELLKILTEAGEGSGIYFQQQPRIKISADDGKAQGEFEIFPLFGLEDYAETSTIAVDENDGTNIPRDAFLILDGNQVYPLNEQVLNLGRRSDNHIVIDNPRVSRMHAQIRAINNRYVIFDLESTGGTSVNNVQVEQAILLPGDVISLSGVEMVYGQDAGTLAGNGGGSTQQLMPYPNTED